MPSTLEYRLAAFLTDEPATRVTNGSARWPGGSFGRMMNEVRSIMVHVTAGWPPREKVEEFVQQYIGPPPEVATRPKAGIGTQYFVSGDGTAMQTIDDMPRVTWHGDHMNAWSIGVETGNLSRDAPPPTNRWSALSQHANDIPGTKLWLSRHAFREVVLSWWTTPTYDGPARQPPGAETRMLFTEWQYRTWALLARYLCEQHDLPRNFPVLPHALRSSTIDNVSVFRRIALADERFPMLARALASFNIEEAHFAPANEATLQERYRAAILGAAEAQARQNRIWTALFDTYRGIHGHGFSGSNRRFWSTEYNAWVGNDHDCPGPLFDWHRFAREVWDWWWYPFDFTDDLSAGSTTRRPESKANGNTPLLEYYFEARDFSVKNGAYVHRTLSPVNQPPHGIFGNISSPSTFHLEPGVPIYAPANGELVAARFPLPDPRYPVSLAFVLVRHEIFHRPNIRTVHIRFVGAVPADRPGRIDYDLEPSYVYSLVMHLGRPDGMSFDTITDANPDWLNRVLMRKKECDLGMARYTTPQAGDPPAARWDSQPPGGAGGRPTLIEGLRADRVALLFFLERLQAGDVAIAPFTPSGVTPLRVILGDFLGQSGVIRQEGSSVQHGIGMEVLAPFFVPPPFTPITGLSDWRPPLSIALPALHYQSEWAKTPTGEERQRLEGIGVNPALVPWWREASVGTWLDPTVAAEARLDREGRAYHFRPLDFMRWINEVTWASEWPKYKVTNADGTEVPRPPRPRSRRV